MILRIAHNVTVSLLRKIRDEAWDPGTMPERTASEDVSRTVVERDDLVAMGEALDGLDELSRSLIVLREVEGLSYDEIAETLEISLPTVKTRLLRARRTFAGEQPGEPAMTISCLLGLGFATGAHLMGRTPEEPTDE